LVKHTPDKTSFKQILRHNCSHINVLCEVWGSHTAFLKIQYVLIRQMKAVPSYKTLGNADSYCLVYSW